MGEFIEANAGQHLLGRKIAAAGAIVGFGLSMAGCGSYKPEASNAFDATCSRDPVELPTAFDVSQMDDERVGNVFACDYLNDLRIPYNTPTKLVKVEEERVTQGTFQSSGDLGGFVIFGFGVIDGDQSANGTITEQKVSVFRFIDSDGLVQTAQIPTEKTKISICKDDCEPTVTFEIPEAPLFVKQDENGNHKHKEDDTSIWDRRYLYDGKSNDFDYRRDNTVNAVTTSENSPATASQVLPQLCNQIIITVPKTFFQDQSK